MQLFKNLLAVLGLSYTALALVVSPIVGGTDYSLTQDVFYAAPDGRDFNQITAHHLITYFLQELFA